MKFVEGWWFPDDEQHLIAWMKQVGQKRDGVLQYQLHKYEAALRFTRQDKRLGAVDIGAHIGQWSRNMAMDFAWIDAFEPVPRFAECWRKNFEHVRFECADLHEFALGERLQTVSLTTGTPGSNGDTFVADLAPDNVAPSVSMRTLDSFCFTDVDFLKIDCEGYELFVIRGGEQTIRREKPCIIVEQKPGHAEKYGVKTGAAVELLKNWGAVHRQEMSGDHIMSWDT